MDLNFHHNLQTTGFSVYILRIDGTIEQMCRDTTAKDAALAFWHYANNLSAKSGIVQRVTAFDPNGDIVVMWEFGRGYSYDGKTYRDKPILMDS
jgi:hypothetical protein